MVQIFIADVVLERRLLLSTTHSDLLLLNPHWLLRNEIVSHFVTSEEWILHSTWVLSINNTKLKLQVMMFMLLWVFAVRTMNKFASWNILGQRIEESSLICSLYYMFYDEAAISILPEGLSRTQNKDCHCSSQLVLIASSVSSLSFYSIPISAINIYLSLFLSTM